MSYPTPLFINKATVSSRSPKGAQSVQRDANGNYIIYGSPTNQTQTNTQTRTMAHGEVDSLGDTFLKGQLPYLGIGGTFRHLADSVEGSGIGNYFFSPDDVKAAQDRLTNYTLSSSIRPELAQAIDRYSSGKPTVEGSRAIKEDALGNKYFTPSPVAQAAMKKYIPTQTKAFQAAVQPDAQNFPINAGKNAPQWASAGYAGGGRTPTWDEWQANVRAKMRARDQAAQAQQQPQPRPAAQSKPSAQPRKTASSSSVSDPDFLAEVARRRKQGRNI